MTNQTQQQWVVEQLKKHGFVTRNQCLRNYITRLSAIIFELKDKKGFEFESFFQENKTLFGTEKDFVYKWKNPSKDVEIMLEFTFNWIDEDNNETPLKIMAKTFTEACDIFLLNSPIFLFAINEEVEDNCGSIHLLESNQKFAELRTYSKPKKRRKNE